ncbi:hypothetical protein CHLRE_04g214801v5 [Chlamydomonas reinhardtii]|uniref:Uncharacterized protein n=1 Tax=Chlamydomonas reinhardtii TaxID=3055 RepID=A0A2K3DTT1_CHLRE|nr:uncharacterized protein CHLRE_04g214801v5 [Chlamydomonas reinhardtii]XP_042925113.1 uncharacterized protein CHLRE_04g214801v5 [Chlamydomonas reinhardtii]PNW83937.1 hypothetical protein CHLRE_04g214801v5 [Chlamydomonas reinhardtii]PNW83938.1 hypothetical protein CHLRE_04g214801v5 [Chlamydomonas reinhardtii]
MARVARRRRPAAGGVGGVGHAPACAATRSAGVQPLRHSGERDVNSACNMLLLLLHVSNRTTGRRCSVGAMEVEL